MVAGTVFLGFVIAVLAPAAMKPQPCFPPQYSVQPESSRPGGQVTVSAPDAKCNPSYGPDARVEVSLTDSAGLEVLRTTAPMNNDGGFSFTFRVPASAKPGGAAVTAVPYGLDWCDDTGTNNRLRRQSAGETALLQASCATPVVPLLIQR